MRISKLMLNLTALAFVAGFAANASASSSANAVCNMRDSKSRFTASNPEKTTEGKRQSQGPDKRYSRKVKGNK